MIDAHWDIRRGGRSWKGDESRQRAELRPEKLEIWDGRLLFEEQERIDLLGLLLETLGADQTVRMGKPEVWVEAVREAHPHVARNRFFGDPFERWMVAMWLMTTVVVWTLALLPKRMPPFSPPVSWMLLTVMVSAFVSFVVSGFLKLYGDSPK